MRHGPPLIIAHRGDSAHSLENSMAAVRAALSLPVEMIEVDIRKSRDGRLYVLHDAMTGRTAQENINIERASSDRIEKIRLKNDEPIPTLEMLLAEVNGACALNLEIKSNGAGALTAQQVRSSGYKGAILISSFKEHEVAAAREVMPMLRTSLIFDVFAGRNVLSYKKRGYSVISLRKKTVSRNVVAACHEQGIEVYVWTVDDEDEMRKYIDLGVDGIYTNRPAVLSRLVAG